MCCRAGIFFYFKAMQHSLDYLYLMKSVLNFCIPLGKSTGDHMHYSPGLSSDYLYMKQVIIICKKNQLNPIDYIYNFRDSFIFFGRIEDQ